MSNTQHKDKTAQYKQLIGQGLQNGEYRIERQLGQGGMGQVFLARHVELDLLFALKQARADKPLPEEVTAELERMLYSPALPGNNAGEQRSINDFPLSGGVNTDHFLREVLLMARLNHPAIPMLYDYFLEDGYWYLVMDYIPGDTLAMYMHKNVPLQSLESLNYAMQLCDVLEYLHQLQPPVIFRDLKPSNIILTPEGRLMLIDFGIARYFKEGHVNDTIELGSPGYAPPEQYQGAGQTDWRSDLYSLGVILHEMLSGKRPTGITGILEPLHQFNPNFSSALSALVTVVTRHQPQHRFQSAYALYQALERVYTIEESKAYSQQVLDSEETTELNRYPDRVVTSLPMRKNEVIPYSQLRSSVVRKHVLTERIEIRRMLQKLHRRRDAPEIPGYQQDTLVDDSLAAIPHVPSMPDLVASSQAAPLPHSSVTTFHVGRRKSMLSLISILLIISLLATFLLYQRTLHTGKQGAEPTPRKPIAQPTMTIVPPQLPAQLGSWQQLPPLPAPAADNSSVFVHLNGRDYIYMTGGFRGPTQTPRYDHSLYRYNIAAAHWEVVLSTGFPGMINNAIALDEHNTIFFTSGYSTDTSSIDSLLYAYQPDTGSLKKITPPTQMPLGFGGAMLADQQGHLYLSEGFMQAGDSGIRAGTGWYRYDIASGTWQMLASLPLGLGNAILTESDTHTLLLLGGSKDAGQNHSSNSIYRYDIQNDRWSLQPTTLPTSLSAAASCQEGDKQILIGGFDSDTDLVQKTSWLFDLKKQRWQPLASQPDGGSFLGTAACNGKGVIYFTRGASDPERPEAGFWKLTLH